MECYSCYAISRFYLAIYGRRIDLPASKCISMCCREGSYFVPTTALTDNAEENLERYLGMRQLAIIQGLSDDAKEQDFPCAKCELYVKGNWSFAPHVSDVNLSLYPSPCQCRCFYCEEHTFPYNSHEYCNKHPEVLSAYEHVFDMLKLAKKLRVILPQKARWQVASGEITIHPYRKTILDFVKGEHVWLYTNGFIFDEDIARELHDNPMAFIDLSMDSGTPETWHKVKGVNNFRHVLENLKAYRKASQRAGQIILKYIICPDINDSEEDFRSFVDIVKALDVQNVILSRDLTGLDNPSSSDVNPKVVEATARLLAICSFKGVVVSLLHGYTADEQQCIKILAQKIFQYMR